MPKNKRMPFAAVLLPFFFAVAAASGETNAPDGKLPFRGSVGEIRPV
jgi:hypothetical protein